MANHLMRPTCDHLCPRQHHEALRRLLNATEELLAASRDLRRLAAPDGESVGDWRYILDAVRGMEWTVKQCQIVVSGEVLACCLSDAEVMRPRPGSQE